MSAVMGPASRAALSREGASETPAAEVGRARPRALGSRDVQGRARS